MELIEPTLSALHLSIRISKRNEQIKYTNILLETAGCFISKIPIICDCGSFDIPLPLQRNNQI